MTQAFYTGFMDKLAEFDKEARYDSQMSRLSHHLGMHGYASPLTTVLGGLLGAVAGGIADKKKRKRGALTGALIGSLLGLTGGGVYDYTEHRNKRKYLKPNDLKMLGIDTDSILSLDDSILSDE